MRQAFRVYRQINWYYLTINNRKFVLIIISGCEGYENFNYKNNNGANDLPHKWPNAAYRDIQALDRLTLHDEIF